MPEISETEQEKTPKVQRVKTGIEKLDKHLNGGFPKNSTILLIGPPGSCKTIFINQFINKGLELGESSLYITTDHSPEQVKEMAVEFSQNFKVHENQKLIFIDAYSWREGKVNKKFAVESLGDLNQLNMVISDALSLLGKKEKRISLDSISSMILYTDPDTVTRFLQMISAKSKASNGTLIMSIEKGVHDKKTINMLNYVSDGCIELTIENNKRFMRITKMAKTSHPLDWLPFDIFGYGLDLL